ncbi:MAG: hypothetical protein WB543_00340 [Candidatus Acidiferrum sp.]
MILICEISGKTNIWIELAALSTKRYFTSPAMRASTRRLTPMSSNQPKRSISGAINYTGA